MIHVYHTRQRESKEYDTRVSYTYCTLQWLKCIIRVLMYICVLKCIKVYRHIGEQQWNLGDFSLKASVSKHLIIAYWGLKEPKREENCAQNGCNTQAHGTPFCPSIHESRAGFLLVLGCAGARRLWTTSARANRRFALSAAGCTNYVSRISFWRTLESKGLK